MAETDRKALIRQYKETPQPAGIFRVRNTVTGKSLIGTSNNLPGMLNRQRFQLEQGAHPDSELQKDWNELGPRAFAFEVLDRLEPKEDSILSMDEELRLLKEMWLEQLKEAGVPIYRQSLRGTRTLRKPEERK